MGKARVTPFKQDYDSLVGAHCSNISRRTDRMLTAKLQTQFEEPVFWVVSHGQNTLTTKQFHRFVANRVSLRKLERWILSWKIEFTE